MKKKLVLMTSALMAIGLLSACNQHHHSFKEVKEVAATCTEAGTKAHYICEGCDKIFDADKNETTLEELKIAAIGHDYKFNSFVWADDYSAKAKYVCSHDSSHIENHDAIVTSEVTTEPTCETKGAKIYTATYDGHTETKNAEVEATGHKWGEPTYVWAEDNSTCTARRVCANDPTHVEEETARAVEYVTISPTCTADGEADLIVSFENKAFENQVIEHVPVKSTGHYYIFDSFVWADDYSSAQAKYVCFKDSSHIELYNATVSSEVVTDPTCEEEGLKEYYAIYEDHKNTVEVKIPALGHKLVHVDAKESKCAEDGNVEHWHCTVCGKNYSDSEGKYLLDNVVVPSKGHTVESVTYEWSADHKTCTAKGTCSVCHEEAAETVNTAEGELESTDCYLYGLVASFKTKGFEPQIYDYYKFTLNDDKASYSIVKGNHLPSDVVIPNEINKMPVTKIGYEGFYSTDITSIVVSKNIVVIDRYGISYSHELISIDFEEGSKLERIENCGIVANYSLKSINNLPASLTYIGDLYYNDECTSITYLGTMAQWRAIEKKTNWNESTPACSAIHCSDGDVDDHWVDPYPDPDDDDEW